MLKIEKQKERSEMRNSAKIYQPLRGVLSPGGQTKTSRNKPLPTPPKPLPGERAVPETPPTAPNVGFPGLRVKAGVYLSKRKVRERN